MRALALHEAYVEYANTTFCFRYFFPSRCSPRPIFLIRIQMWLHWGINSMGQGHVPSRNFWAARFYRPFLITNIVADFASRGLHGLVRPCCTCFAMAQISGYALGAAGRTSGAPNRWWPSHLSGATWKRLHAAAMDERHNAGYPGNHGALTAVIYLGNALLRWLH